MAFKLKTNHITIETTNLCDGNCVMCPREKYDMKPETMKMTLWKKIIDDLATHGYKEKLVIDTQGFGDPFFDPLFFKRLEYAKKKIPCIQTFTSSNCYRMTKDKYPEVLKYIDTLRISFYGMTKEVYEKLHRGNLMFEKSLFNILNFLQYKNEHFESKHPWVISQMLIIEGINNHQIDAFKEFWESRTDELIMWTPHNFGGLRNYRGAINHSKQVSCGRPVNGPAYVHVDGIVSMCCWDINESLVIGDLKTQTLEEVFQSEPYEIIRQKHLKKDFRGLYCWHCEQTTPTPSCLYYTNKDRKPCVMTSDRLEFTKELS